MWVVKIGGSLAASESLLAWLDALTCYGSGNVTIVPGGGPFADQVRSMQRCWRFSDRAAHHMALLSMEQYGLMMCDLRQELLPVRTVQDVQHAVNCARAGVWMPTTMTLRESSLPVSWDLSADSLAAWLAHALGAQGLLVVKAVPLGTNEVSCAQLTAQRTVDPLFCRFVAEAPFATWICGPEDHVQVRSALGGDGGCGAAVARLNEPLIGSIERMHATRKGAKAPDPS